MDYEIVLTDTAKEHYKALDARSRKLLKDGMNKYLSLEPMKVSRSRIKRLRAILHPEFRLRLAPFRIFYDVTGNSVVVLAIVPKMETSQWLNVHGVKSS